MRVSKSERLNVHRITVSLDGADVAQTVCDRVADELGLDRVMAANYLVVKLSDTYATVRGEIPLTREQQLEALGLTPTEPVETDGAAIAEGLPEQLEAAEAQALQHDVDAEDRRQLEAKLAKIEELERANADAPGWGAAVAARGEELRELYLQASSLRKRLATSDLATFREEMTARQVADEAFSKNTAEALDKISSKLDTSSVGEAATRANEGLRHLQGVGFAGGSGGGGNSRGPVTYHVVFPNGGVSHEQAVKSARGLLETVEKLRAVVGDLSTPEGQAKVREMVRKTVEGARQHAEKPAAGSVVALRIAVMARDSRLREIRAIVESHEDVYPWGQAREAILKLCDLDEGGPAVGDDTGVQVGTGGYAADAVRLEADLGQVPMVPRTDVPIQPVVSAGALYTARLRLAEMLGGLGRPPATFKRSDVEYVLALLGGSPWGDLPSAAGDPQTAETWAGLVETKPESRSAAAQERRRTLMKLADRLLHETLLTDLSMTNDVRSVLEDVEQELRRMSR